MTKYIPILVLMLFCMSPKLIASDFELGNQTTDDRSPQRISIENQAPFCADVNDRMSFTEAFVTARRKLGAGGFFNWKGKSYNTYYAEELARLESRERKDYASKVRTSRDYLPWNIGGEEDPDVMDR